MINLTVKKEQRTVEVDDSHVPGSPPIVGRGRTLKEAVGDWVLNNQDRVGVKLFFDATAETYEQKRRRRQSNKRTAWHDPAC